MTGAYCASKGGIDAFTKSVALHCCERGYGIRCNSIHPGFIETRLGDNALHGSNDGAAR